MCPAKRAKVEGEVEIKVEEPKVMEKPTLVRMEEFLQSISEKYSVESLGGFIFSVKRRGTPPKLPIQLWEKKLEEYLGKKI